MNPNVAFLVLNAVVIAGWACAWASEKRNKRCKM